MQVFAGLSLGMILSTILGVIVFQAAMFRMGMEELGIGQIGFSYFVGAFLASLYFALTGGRKVFLLAFPIAVVLVGALGLNQVMADPYAATSGDMFNIEANLHAMGQVVSNCAFWVGPGIVTAIYAITRWQDTRIPVEKLLDQ